VEVIKITQHYKSAGYVPSSGYLEELIQSYPNFNDPEYKKDKEDKDVMKGVINEQGKKVDLKPIPLQ
jgi:hypothetical protein